MLAALVTTACGKKGPPLVPYAKAPAAPAEATARRLGNRVEIRFTVPTVDLDGQRPAHIDRIEVWALTGQVPDPILFLKYATLVGTVPVRRPPPPPPDVEEGKPPPPPPPPSTEPGLDQGQPGLVVDELDAEALVPVVVPEIEKQKARDEELRLKRLAEQEPPRLTPPDLGTPLPPPLMRYYVVMGRNGGRKGASTQRLPVALRPAPPAPPQPTSTLAENYVELAWTEPPGLPKPVHKGTAPPAVAPASVATAPGARATACAWCAAPGGAPPVAPTRRRRRRRRRRLRAAAAPSDASAVDAPPEVPAPAPPPAPVALARLPHPGGRRRRSDAGADGAELAVAHGVSVRRPSAIRSTRWRRRQQAAPAPLQPGEVPALPRRATPRRL